MQAQIYNKPPTLASRWLKKNKPNNTNNYEKFQEDLSCLHRPLRLHFQKHTKILNAIS